MELVTVYKIIILHCQFCPFDDSKGDAHISEHDVTDCTLLRGKNLHWTVKHTVKLDEVSFLYTANKSDESRDGMVDGSVIQINVSSIFHNY